MSSSSSSTTSAQSALLGAAAASALWSVAYYRLAKSFSSRGSLTAPSAASSASDVGGSYLINEALACVSKRWSRGFKEDIDTPVVRHLDALPLIEELGEDLRLGDAGTSAEKLARILTETLPHRAVNTSHPFFFNQLFGTMDRSALAAELVCTSLNTSGYTFEVGTVLSVIERETLTCAAGLLGWDYPAKCDGLTVPGGSTGNLMGMHTARFHHFPESRNNGNAAMGNNCVAFISEEAHYSFLKMFNLLGLGIENMVHVGTTSSGSMCPEKLEAAIVKAKKAGKTCWFVGATAGSTVKGTFDPLDAMADICQKHKIWFHVDGAWGGSAILSKRPDMVKLMKGAERADSFTFNPHKLLGAPLQTTCFLTNHKGILAGVNASSAGYLFDKRKRNAEFDIGDDTFMCGRKIDAVKFWAMWKYHGRDGLAARIEAKVDVLKEFEKLIEGHKNFMLACDTWPFNVNLIFLPDRIVDMCEKAGFKTDGSMGHHLPEEIEKEVLLTAIEMKKRMQHAGTALIPFQPLAGQKVQVFRFVLCGDKDQFGKAEFERVMQIMVDVGKDL